MGQEPSDDQWDWTFSPRGESQFAQLDPSTQDRIMDKLEEVVSSEWREPEDFLEPLTGSPYRKLRIGGYRVGCRLRHETKTLRVESVRKREDAYKGDDD